MTDVQTNSALLMLYRTAAAGGLRPDLVVIALAADLEGTRLEPTPEELDWVDNLKAILGQASGTIPIPAPIEIPKP